MDIFKDFNVSREEGRLKNGIKVILFYRSGTPIATSAVLLSGSRYDSLEMPGVAHFLEHMITNGSKEFPTKDLLAEHIESVGGSYGAKTGPEVMWVNTEVSEKEDYDRVVDIFRATLCNPLMDKKVFENEKNVVVKEIHKGDSNPNQVLGKTIRQLFFKDTEFEHPVMGDEKSIMSLDYDKTILEYKKLFDKSRIIFVCAGDISLKELISNLEKLDFLEGYDFVREDKELNISSYKKVLSTYFDTAQTHIFLGTKSPKMLTKDSLYLNLVGDILAGGRNSRLTKRLRYGKGLIYGVGYNRYGGQEFGVWGFSTDTTEKNVQEVIDEIVKEIKDVTENGIKESELEFVKNRRIKSLKRSMQTSGSWADFHELAELFPDRKFNINTYIKSIQEADLISIKKVVDTYLKGADWKLALCGRTKEEDIKINW